MKRTYRAMCHSALSLLLSTLSACGLEEINSRSSKVSAPAEINEANLSSISLKKHPSEEVVESVVFGIKSGFGLNETWSVELEQKKNVTTNVAPKLYLNVTGELASADISGTSSLGCLQIEMLDNVNYREQGWLRIATNGIRGLQYSEVIAPIAIQQNGWTDLPILEESLTLGKFPVNTVKTFKGSICFRIDGTGLPAQNYAGQVIVQYLKTKTPQPEPAPDLQSFACTTTPKVINPGERVTLTWQTPDSIDELRFRILSQTTQSGKLENTQDRSVDYIAPLSVPTAFVAMIEASPDDDNFLPVFCEVQVTANDDIGVGDDGELQGITGNVYKLNSSTQKLPDFASMSPVSHIVAANLDIPQRSFSSGFPGVKDLFEWFGIRFDATLKVPATCNPCRFKLVADDGANFYVNGHKVIDNDGVHATRAVEGSINLAAGEHQIRVDYFQGPRYHITLQLMWDLGQGYVAIPSSAFSRPLR